MKKVILVLAVILMLVSCSAEIVVDLPAEEIKPNSSEINSEVLSGNSFSISFAPVPYASDYKYSLNGGESRSFSTSTYQDGIITAVISDVPDQSGTVELYAVSSSTGSEVSIASASYALTLSRVEPDAYLSARNETSAEIRVYTSLEDGSVVYLAEVKDEEDGTVIPIYSESSVIIVEGLEPGKSYTAEIYHALKDGEELKGEGSVSTAVEIPAYSQGSQVVMSLDINPDSVAMVSNIPEGVRNVSLMKSSDALLSDAVVLNDYDVYGSEARFGLSLRYLKCLESGYFYIQAGDYRSNTVKYTRPLEHYYFEQNFQSFAVAFSFADDFDSADYDIYVDGISNEITSEENGRVTVSNLASNTDYGTVTLCFRNKETQEVFEWEHEVRTRSFAGTYYWNNPSPEEPINFIIDVTESEPGSAYPYYVYFNEHDQIMKDEQYNGRRLRIMPLIDTAAGDPDYDGVIVNVSSPSAGFEEANLAYSANGGKWNSSPFSPTSWKVGSVAFGFESVTVNTLSAALGMSNPSFPTTTVFEFREYDFNRDGRPEPYVKFKNTSTNLLVSMYLETNPAPQSEKFGDLAESQPEYCWYLVRGEDLEAEK